MIVNVHMMKIIELLNGILSSNLIIDNELKGLYSEFDLITWNLWAYNWVWFQLYICFYDFV